jgi:hypothetical protein
MASLTIKEAAERLGISEVTIRRRLRTGQLKGYQESPPTGKWFIEVSDDDVEQDKVDADDYDDHLELVGALRDTITRQDEVIALLTHQLEAREREVQELHVLLQQAQTALPAAGDNRSWWYKLWHRNGR